MTKATKTENVQTAADIGRLITERGITHIKVGFFDLDGVMAGKYMSAAKFLAALESNYAFCDVVFGWDLNDQLFDNIKLSGWITGYADLEVRLLPELWRELPLEKNTILVPGEVVGRMQPLCPRQILKNVMAKAEAMGFTGRAGFEYEFLVTD